MSYPNSFYARTRTAGPDRPPMEGEHEAEVCIVGGGLAGLNTALALGQRGISVILLEARSVGFGASGRNGGFVGRGYSQELSTLVDRLGLDHARALYDLTGQATALVRRRIDDHAIACGPNTTGVLVATWTDKADDLHRYIDWMAQNFGTQQRFVPREQVAEEFAISPVYFDALYGDQTFQFHPLNYCLGIASAAEAAGVRIFEDSAVTAMETERPEKLVVTGRGQVRARHVVLTCGGYGLGVLPDVSGAVLPVATYVMATEPIPQDVLATAIRKKVCMADTRRAGDYYRALPDGRILWGGRMTARIAEPPRLARLMLDDLLTVYPQLRGHARVESAWTGTMSYARHRMPQIGRLRDGVWYGQAFGGSGMATTTVAGELLAEGISGQSDRYRLFEPFGLDWAGGPFGRIAAQAIYWTGQMQDAAAARRDRRARKASGAV
ncbi:MAG: FAD-dependent oxidoreductase [Proteobacteria bacterium]|nr:FAD-dependent oxidoreductase [Pseudomonadota bacterium]